MLLQTTTHDFLVSTHVYTHTHTHTVGGLAVWTGGHLLALLVDFFGDGLSVLGREGGPLQLVQETLLVHLGQEDSATRLLQYRQSLHNHLAQQL